MKDENPHTNSPIGLWIIGARGQIATIVAVGLECLKMGLIKEQGLVSSHSCFKSLPLFSWEQLVIGGVDIREGSLLSQAERLCCAGEFSPSFLSVIKDALNQLDKRIVLGTCLNCGDVISAFAKKDLKEVVSIKDTISSIRKALRDFRRVHGLERIVVVNLASTEPPAPKRLTEVDLAGLETLFARNEIEHIRASTLYSYATIKEGCPYINFTPSQAAIPQAILELAYRERVPVMGNDGKTGETLVKSALAPMFFMRNLKVLSWQGYNILGNRDGEVLQDPVHKESKIKTKGEVLSEILGYRPHSRVSIDYVPSLDDQKTAWDFIHFEGFLGAKMTLQFIWQGYDSILAAPLVLDLVRFTEYAARTGEIGVLKHLAFFFKSPITVDTHDLSHQFELLKEYALKVQKRTLRQSASSK